MRIQIRQRMDPQIQSMDIKKSLKKSAYPGSIGGSYIRKTVHGWATGLSETEEKNYGDILGLDLTKRSDYWETFMINTLDPKNDYLTLDTSKPHDFLSYKAAIASGVVAPDRQSLNEKKYLDTNYYFHNISLETEKRKSTKKAKNKLIQKLASQDSNEEWLLYVNHALGLYLNAGVTVDRMYNQLDEKISKLNGEREIKAVAEVLDRTPLDLQIEFVVDRAINTKILSYDTNNSQYVFDSNQWGVNRQKAIEKLKDPQYGESLEKLSKIILKDFIDE